jgi:hypothetical protein
MAVGILYGFALEMSLAGLDHTYVVSSLGDRWPCWGRDQGGTEICSGTGSVAQAQCLSEPESHAGIQYGMTGVCHQTANRILSPARVTVAKASGARQSFLLYGVWGVHAWTRRHYHPDRFPWPELRTCS